MKPVNGGLGHQRPRWSVSVTNYLFGLVHTHRLRKEVTLTAMTEQLPQQGHLLLGLDTLGYDIHSQVLRQHQDRPNDFNVFFVIHDARNEGTVDLQRVDGEPVQVAERRITRTKVVNAEPYAKCAQLKQHGGCCFDVIHDHAFRDLEFQTVRIESTLVETTLHLIYQIGLSKLFGRQVNCNK